MSFEFEPRPHAAHRCAVDPRALERPSMRIVYDKAGFHGVLTLRTGAGVFGGTIDS